VPRCARSGCRRPRPLYKGRGRKPRYCSHACRQAAHYRRRRRQRSPLEVLGSSRSVEWPTHPETFARLVAQYGPFTLDPCATPENAKCPTYFTREQDGLRQPWTGRVFMNPPYGRTLGAWVRKALGSVRSGDAELVVCLVPARVDTAWWHDCVIPYGEVQFLRGRLRFVGAENNAPFPSAVVVFRRKCESSRISFGGGA
jgi:phage N-6-adenine-methyltransferase